MNGNDTVTEQFYEIVMDVLGADREEITPAARFAQDLGGESIDMLELSFRCEKQFGIKIQFQKVLPTEKLVMDEQGRFTDETLNAIQSALPSVNLSTLKENPTLDTLWGLITIGALNEYLHRQLSAPTEAGVKVGNAPLTNLPTA